MTKKILKAKDVERLENTSVVALVPLGEVLGGDDLRTVCGVYTCEQGACTGTIICGLTGGCGTDPCGPTHCMVTCAQPGVTDLIGVKIIRG